MTERIPQSTAKTVVFKAYLASDHVTEATGKTIAITISKNGGAFGNPNAGATNATEISSGWYKVALDTTDTGTLGPIAFRGAVALVDDVGILLEVVSATSGGYTNLDAAITTRMATYTQPTGFLSATFPAGTVANTTNITAGTITTVTTVTNQLTAAAIATGIWTDTTAGDFTTALSVGKSVMNGVSLGTGLTINDLTTKTGFSLSSPQTFNLTGNITGALSGSVGSVTARVTANTDQVNGNATAASNVSSSMQAIARATCSGGTITTAVVSSMTSPSSLTATGQLIGRTILFDSNTTTAALQGQASNITSSTTGATPTITFTAMTTAPANTDTFSVV